MSAPSLATWQTAFCAYLQHGVGEDWLSAQTAQQHIAAELCLDVYRHAYYSRLQESLAQDFPALRATLGDHDFGRLMAEYLHAHPSTSPSLRQLGQALPAWLHTQAQKAYAELAAIEWAVLNAFDAADAPPLAGDALAQIAPQAWAQLRIRLHPSLSLLALESNAGIYWQKHRQGETQIALTSCVKNWLVIVRHAIGPALINISEAQYEILLRLSHGETVATICAERMANGASSETPQRVAKTLARAVASGWVCDLQATA